MSIEDATPATDDLADAKQNLATDLRASIDEVFEKHRDLLLALMDRAPRPAADGEASITSFSSIIAVLDIYALEIRDVDRIIWQPNITTTVVYNPGMEIKS